MLLHLAERLTVPLRERNILLVAAGYAPVFPERSLDEPALHAARKAVELVLAGHEPFPALAVDRHWTLLAANKAVPPLLAGVDPTLLQPPVNVLRLSLHPAGLAPRIHNLGQWRTHLLARLRHQVGLTADPVLVDLWRELSDYPVSQDMRLQRPGEGNDHADVIMPFQLNTKHGLLSFFTTTTIFGTPIDVTLSELALETFFPADATTAKALRRPATED